MAEGKEKKSADITPLTKISELLANFPKLEQTLIEMAPAFKKLRHPILRQTIARVTTLRQAAQVGGVPLDEMITRLRAAAGLAIVAGVPEQEDLGQVLRPNWVDQGRIIRSFDARPLLEAGQQPLAQILSDLKMLTQGEIYELITPFPPAPIVEKAKQLGFETWSKEISETETRTFFRLP